MGQGTSDDSVQSLKFGFSILLLLRRISVLLRPGNGFPVCGQNPLRLRLGLRPRRGSTPPPLSPLSIIILPGYAEEGLQPIATEVGDRASDRLRRGIFCLRL